MRWLLIVTLLCNGIYFIWEHFLRAPAVEPVAAQQVTYSGAQQLVLLGERTAESAPASPSSIPSIQAAPPPPPMCWQIGPFKEELTARQVAARLDAVGIVLEVTTLVIPGEPDYWVHIPPQASRKEALSKLRELQSRKIDSFLIADGDLENGISLGFFTERARAETVLLQRRKQGYAAEIREVPRSSSQIWGRIGPDDFDRLADPLWEKVIAGTQGLERRKNYCDKIASPGNIE